MSPQRRQPLGQRVHDWLSEPEGQQFYYGKWRFWFVAVAGLQLLSALLTALIFQSAGNLESHMGAVLLGVGALVGWIAVGCLHYSDSSDRTLARGVSALDSITLLFVIGHFCFLTWTYGHLKVIQSAEAEYRVQVEKFNTEAREVQAANVEIARSAERIAQEATKAERLRNDTMYQARKAAEAGAAIRAPRSTSTVAPGLQTSQVELERPKAPEESSAQFMKKWDGWIRAMNFGELLLCALTLIFIRNQTARSAFIPLTSTSSRSRVFNPALSTTQSDTVSSKRDDTDANQKTTRVVNREGLKRLREVLKLIGFHSKSHFKVDVKLDGGYLWIRQFKSRAGEAETIGSARARLSLLDSAARMEPEKFRSELEQFLRERDFRL